jgi:hypothetical protein
MIINAKDDQFEKATTQNLLLFHTLKASPSIQSLSNLNSIRWNPTSVVDLFKSFTRHTTTHIGRLRGGKQRRIAEIIDTFLPSLGRLRCRVDVLEVVTLHLTNAVDDPTSLDLNRAWAIGKKSWTMRAIEMEHVRITSDGSAEVGICGSLPFILKIGVVDAFEAHMGHATCGDVLSNVSGIA